MVMFRGPTKDCSLRWRRRRLVAYWLFPLLLLSLASFPPQNLVGRPVLFSGSVRRAFMTSVVFGPVLFRRLKSKPVYSCPLEWF